MTALGRIVVVGNGIAGTTAADTLRAEGYDGEIVLIGDEPHPAYSRPALSKALLRDESDRISHLLPPPTHGAIELLGVRATGLDPVARRVKMADDTELPYDALVVATGCRARRLGGPDELTLRTVDDAWALRERLADRPSVLVVGGGPLGMEIASACIDSGCDVTLVTQGRPLAEQLGTYLADIVETAARSRGLRVVLTAAARSAAGGVVLADGSVIRAELVVTAIGDTPNTEWLASSGLLRNGVLVADRRGRVAPGVVAAGDVAAVPTPTGVRRVPLWNAAIGQSKIAATALLRPDAALPADSRPYFWTEQFGLSLKAIGNLPFSAVPTVLDGDPADGRLLVHWNNGGSAAINYRIPIPRLRRLHETVGSAAGTPAPTG